MAPFTYVEMMCRLDPSLAKETVLDPTLRQDHLSAVNMDRLYHCYLETFQRGDAQFFQRQGEDDRRRYFEQELGFPAVFKNPASHVIFMEETLVGFSLVMSYLEKNYHISCMCILPAYQGRGLGLHMISQIQSIALINGIKTLTLGTEPGMKAFQLYQKAGFEITAEHTVGL